MNIKQINEELDKLLEFDRNMFNQEPGYYDRKFGYDKTDDYLYNDVSIDDKKMKEYKVKNIIKSNNLDYYIYPCDDDRVAVEVDGDWKHDHAYFDNLMRSHGFILDDKTLVGEETGDDSYTAIHYYKEI